ncbi:MAG: T9SS type A sorting domain-containing protein, partial [Salibacteraceae bacterium]
FTSEVGSRRSSYSVNSVPSVFRNAEGILATNFDTVKINADLDEMCSMKMDLRYMIDTNVQWVRVRARIEALDDYSSNGHRLMIPILENTTYKNKETNGETEFHNVFKKMLPESNGELIIGEIEAGEVIEYDSTYTFQGDYRLPNSAQDPINHATEHSIEEFDDIHVVMFMQSLVNREIYQGAIGVREFTEANMDRDWGDDRLWPLSIAEFNKNKGFVVSPNPANGFTSVHFSKDFNAERIELVDVQGRVVLSKTAPFAQKFNLSVSDLVSGVYFFRAQSSEGLIQTKKMIVHH